MAAVGALIVVAGLVGLIRPSWLRLKNRWWALGVIVVGLGLAGAGAGDGSPTEPTEQPAQADVAETDPVSDPEDEAAAEPEPVTEPTAQEPEPEPEPEIEPAPAETVSQRNAVRKAEEYLRFMAFSKQGLIEQLEFEGFSTEDATYAVDQIDVDWR